MFKIAVYFHFYMDSVFLETKESEYLVNQLSILRREPYNHANRNNVDFQWNKKRSIILTFSLLTTIS